MQKCIFLIVFAGLISAFPSLAKNRHGGLNQDIQSEREEYEEEQNEQEQAWQGPSSECDDDWSIEDSFYSDTPLEQTPNDSEELSENNDEDECSESGEEEYYSSQGGLIFEKEEDCRDSIICNKDYCSRKYERSLMSIEKELAELKYNKGSRRYKFLYRLYSNFMRDFEKPDTIKPESRSCPIKYTKKNRCAIRLFRMHKQANNWQEPVQDEMTKSKVMVPATNPDQQRIHINHRQVWSGNYRKAPGNSRVK